MTHLAAVSESRPLDFDRARLAFWRDRGDMGRDPATANIRAIRDYADRLGVQLTVRDSPTGIDLDWLGRRARTPRGAGAAVMDRLCAYADHTGRPVSLLVLAGRD